MKGKEIDELLSNTTGKVHDELKSKLIQWICWYNNREVLEQVLDTHLPFKEIKWLESGEDLILAAKLLRMME